MKNGGYVSKTVGKLVLVVVSVFMMAACTEETMNKLSRQADNFLGEDLKVSYVDGGQVVKSWIVIIRGWLLAFNY